MARVFQDKSLQPKVLQQIPGTTNKGKNTNSKTTALQLYFFNIDMTANANIGELTIIDTIQELHFLLFEFDVFE